jgi:hypothetical protein
MKWTAAALGLLLVAGIWWWTHAGTVDVGVPVDPSVAAPPGTEAASADPVSAPLAAAREPTPDRPPVDRTRAPMATTPQGLRGLVLDAADRPLPGVQVHLLESASNDPLALPLLLQHRLPASALATTATAFDGTFAVGLPRIQDRIYEIYLLSPDHATVRLGELRLLAGEWHDLGAITMGPGATLQGRVIVDGLATPVPNAVITVRAGTAFEDVALRGIEEGHRGLVATADGTGHYELRHAPGRGIVQVAAVAPGFARQVRRDVELTTERPITIDFALSPGWTLRGAIHDAEGHAIHEARVEVWPNNSADAAFLAVTDATGGFEVQGLASGPHRVRASARGFQTAEATEIAAGRLDVELVLQRRGRVDVRATTPEGSVLRNYQLSVHRYFEDERGGQIGFVADLPERSVRLDGFTDHAGFDGLPAGTFVCEVTAGGYAKTLSAPFTITAEPMRETLQVDVAVSRGATLRGRVFDEGGAPLAAAEVRTQADGADPESPIWKLLAGAVPARITTTEVTTDADGSFVLPRLALGDYQLEIEHPEACRSIVRQIRIDRATEQSVPPIHVVRGAVVSGRATVGGRRAGQIKVVLMEADAGRQGLTTRLETVTDAEGGFRLPRRVPPGTYELRAAVVGAAEPDSQILRQLLQLQRSSTTVVVPAGQAVVERDIDIPDPH